MAESTVQTLRGSVVRVTFHTEETGYCVLKVIPDGKRGEETLVGKAPRVVAGERFDATGVWEQDRNHGRQFRAEALRLSPPDSEDGMIKYLGSGLIDGIGPKYAKRLIEKFGPQVFDIIENESARLEQVDGIGTKRRREIKESWTKQKSVHAIMMFLHQHGIGTARALRIYKTYGDQALDVIRGNPYRLAADIRGIGFKSADEIAKRMGIEAESRERLQAGITYILEEAAHAGHCFMPEVELIKLTCDALQCDGDRLATLLQPMEAEGLIVKRGESIYLPHLFGAEQRIARQLLRIHSGPPGYPAFDVSTAIRKAEERTGKQLAESQRRCVEAALQNRVLIITGGPGVGKTTILNTLLTVLKPHGTRIVLAAPTGRAAKRMSESTGIESRTLHRLLEYQGEGQWGRNRERPLSGDLFVLDECSMIDAPLMAQFLGALPDGAHLLLVGDADQLPSVGPGMVLGDLIASGCIPCVRLTEIFRQAADSRIITSAHAINRGQVPDLKPHRDSDFFFLEASSPEEIVETITGLVHERLPGRYGFDPVTDIQVLTPMNRNALGTHALNHMIQSVLNPPNELKYELDRFGITFRVGDKVIQTSNNYDKNVFNGDLGILIRIETDPLRVEVRFEGDRVVNYEPGELDELQLAYALTIHKSQGSEFPCVIMPVSTQHFVMLDRSLFYTGVTRARKLVVLVGDAKALRIAVTRQETRKRHTGLAAALKAGDSRND
ncbi:MAG: ATP-dependent RecD-like DNA helicase [Verrucomicrobiaceae bacterium]|nr:ATP-dependent RecD-like DNA helicase [Verrucomicrobiaceae bacterium]